MQPIIGIDLGTTTSVIAQFKDGKPVIIKNPQSRNELTPSVVGINPKTKELIVGEDAEDFFESVVREIKREMGSNKKMKLGGVDYSPEEISSMILKRLKDYGEEIVGTTITEAVITVPASFSIEAKKATEIAAELAGLKPLRIIQEPTAAALAYGVNQIDVDEKILVYDLGGGTFDVSVVEIVDGNVDVMAHEGERYLGGKDFDERIVKHAMERLKSNHGLDIAKDEQAKHRLKIEAKKIKEELSFSPTITLNVPFIGAKNNQPVNLELEISRSQFEQLIDDLIEKTITLAESAIRKAKVKKKDIKKVLLVGGSTRVPYVRKSVKEFFGFEPSTDIEPDFAVAMGATIQASIIKGQSEKFILDRVAYGFGIEAVGEVNDQLISGIYTEIIEPNSQMLKSFEEVYRTISDNQTQVELHCFQREPSNNSLWTSDCVPIGNTQVLEGIPPAKAGEEVINVSMMYNLDGIITVKAIVKSTGHEREFQIKTATGALNESDAEERKAKLNALWQLSKYADKAKSIINSVEKRLHEMKGEDVKKITSLIDELKKGLVEEDLDKIEDIIDKVTDILIEY